MYSLKNRTGLKTRLSRRWYKKQSIYLWHIPARSPDLNPVEKFWAYLRKKLRAMDLKDLQAKRPPVGKFQLKARVRSILSTQQTKQVAKNLMRGLKKTCKLVLKKKGAASGK